MSGIASFSLSVVVAVLISGSVDLVLSSDVNWGKKVSCFVVDGTVVCPGCNYRAGLSCPRKLKDSENCLLLSTQPPLKTEPTSGTETIDEANPTEASYEEINSTEKNFLDYNGTSLQTNEIQRESTKNPIDMTIYLYRILGSRARPPYRFKRELEQTEQEEAAETCNWNGDCPCPLICCKTGPGCPKRCVMGIRLPPPWG